MGALLSRMPPMELKGEEGSRAEPYNMLLLQPDATLRSQRALKRELCLTRAAVLVLALVLGACACLMFLVPLHACKDREHDGKGNEDQNPPAQGKITANYSDLKQPLLDFPKDYQDDEQNEDSDHKQLFSASLRADNCTGMSRPNNGNISWIEKQDLVGFTLQDSKSLVVPKYGMYRISLQVTYRNTDTKKNETEKIILSHSVVVYQQGYPVPKPILEVYESIYWKDLMWMKTKYSQDVFKLDRGDIIRVESSNLNFIKCSTGASFLSVRYEPTG